MPLGLPLRRGDRGEAVRDLQQRLTAAGFDVCPDEPADFGEATEKALLAFQDARGLRADGVCGTQSWSALVEAGFRLGDRLLYHRTPMLRGDDVAELQRRLGTLGFDAGRVDGIFGERTAAAVGDFQRNAGLTVDGTCGPATIAELTRVGTKATGGFSVANLREREALRRGPRTLSGRRVVVAQPGGLDALATALARALHGAGAETMVLDDPDGSEQARQANLFGADLYLGVAPGDRGCVVAYYSTEGFESVGGRRLAEQLGRALDDVVTGRQAGVRGMRLPVLRETRMPAVLCELGPASEIVPLTGTLAGALAQAVAAWAEAPEEV